MPTSLTPAEARRRRKDLEPLRRLSKTTGSLDLSAFRVAVPSTEVTNSCPACNRSGGSCTHGAPRPGPIPERTADHADSPHCNGGPRTCSRSAGVGRASTSDQCDGSRCMRCRGAGSDRSLVTVPSSDARGVTASNGRAVHVAIGPRLRLPAANLACCHRGRSRTAVDTAQTAQFSGYREEAGGYPVTEVRAAHWVVNHLAQVTLGWVGHVGERTGSIAHSSSSRPR